MHKSRENVKNTAYGQGWNGGKYENEQSQGFPDGWVNQWRPMKRQHLVQSEWGSSRAPSSVSKSLGEKENDWGLEGWRKERELKKSSTLPPSGFQMSGYFSFGIIFLLVYILSHSKWTRCCLFVGFFGWLNHPEFLDPVFTLTVISPMTMGWIFMHALLFWAFIFLPLIIVLIKVF